MYILKQGSHLLGCSLLLGHSLFTAWLWASAHVQLTLYKWQASGYMHAHASPPAVKLCLHARAHQPAARMSRAVHACATRPATRGVWVPSPQLGCQATKLGNRCFKAALLFNYKFIIPPAYHYIWRLNTSCLFMQIEPGCWLVCRKLYSAWVKFI